MWTEIVTNMVEEFGEDLDIGSEPIIVDGRVPHSNEMDDLRKQLQITANKIRASTMYDLVSFQTCCG